MLTRTILQVCLAVQLVGALAEAKEAAPNAPASSTNTDKATGVTEWPATLPGIAQNTATWIQLIDEMNDHDMPYGSLAAAHRMLIFFSDLPTKEKAYDAIIRLIDYGYAFPTRSFFITGDLEPKENPQFSNSYYLYKAMAANELGVPKWAAAHLEMVDKTGFEKYLFYQAVEFYRNGELPKAITLLNKVLTKKPEPRQLSLMKKAARTLARIYFEQGNFAKSYDIYESFLLRLDQIEPNDWLEAAWDLYYMKKYDATIGILYNLESRAAGKTVNLEKYVVRALVYEDLCSTEYIERLIRSFEREFGAAIMGVKTGKRLSKVKELNRIYLAENQPFYQLTTSYDNLRTEKKRIGTLGKSVRDLANYLYTTEIQTIKKKYPLYAEEANQRAATHLLSFSENLRFIKYDTTKSRFGAETEDSKPDAKSAKDKDKDGDFKFRWAQKNDFWRDERLHYRAALKNRCPE